MGQGNEEERGETAQVLPCHELATLSPKLSGATPGTPEIQSLKSCLGVVAL